MARRFHAHVLELVLALTEEPGEAKSFAIPLIPPAPFLLEALGLLLQSISSQAFIPPLLLS